ncbi:MAG: GNAT family N-acetyltransferase [Acidimicrobiales bacterium]
MGDAPLIEVSIRQVSVQEAMDIGAGVRPRTGWARDFPQEGDVAGMRYASAGPTGEPLPWSAPWLISVDDVVVGTIGFKGEPVAQELEVGYGVVPSCRRRGVATAALGQLLDTVSDHGFVIKAETAAWNVGSQHVVKKLEFIEVGRRRSDEDGELIVWRRTQS